MGDLLNPAGTSAAFRRQAGALAAWHDGGAAGGRPPGRLLPHRTYRPTAAERAWAAPLYRLVYDPDGRPLRDRIRGRL